MPKQDQATVQTSGVTFSPYYASGVWRCSSSPTGAHHWLIDSRGCGHCKHCGAVRQFAESGASAYGGVVGTDWNPSPSPEEWVREMPSMA